MAAKYKKPLVGSIIAFALGTSCCWLSTLAAWLGAAGLISILSPYGESIQYGLIALAIILLAISGRRIKQARNTKKTLSLLYFLFFSIPFLAQDSMQSQIVGKWQTHDASAIVEIYRENGTYAGLIIQYVDSNGDRVELSERSDGEFIPFPLGVKVLDNLAREDNRGYHGELYNPEDNTTYRCRIRLEDNDTLILRDYCGFFYKDFIWKRVRS